MTSLKRAGKCVVARSTAICIKFRISTLKSEASVLQSPGNRGVISLCKAMSCYPGSEVPETFEKNQVLFPEENNHANETKAGFQ